MHFDDVYEERVTLRTGDVVRVRLIRPSDKEQLAEGMENLSESSRYFRFFLAKSKLTAAELRYLTELDGVDHVALVAGIPQEDGGEDEGIGVARFVRSGDREDAAEAAIIVTDGYQGRGVGTLLLARLGAAARERGIHFFVSEFLSDNEPVRQLLALNYPELELTDQGDGVMRALMPIPDYPLEARSGMRPDSSMRRFLAHAAQGALRVQHQLRVLKSGAGEDPPAN